MSDEIDDTERKILEKAFQMPSVQDMMSRKSSITNAFANAIIPSVQPTAIEIRDALRILKMSPLDVRCAYCGAASSEWDHLRPLVLNRRATGYITEIANLVPACGKCNQSKGNKPWREWMRSSARWSPASRGVADIEQRIATLEAFENWKEPRCLNVEAIIGSDAWNAYWALCDKIIAEMQSAQGVANDIRAQLGERLLGQ